MTVLFGETNHTKVKLSISSLQHGGKIATLLIFLLQVVSVETVNQCGGRKKTSSAKK